MLLAAAALLTAGRPAAAQDNDVTDGHGFVTVIEVSGLIDEVVVRFVDSSISEAESGGARGLVLQLDSPGAVAGDEALSSLARRIRDAEIPVSVWVGPSGAQALGGAAQLAAAAEVVGVSIGSRIGETGEPILEPDEFGPLFGEAGAVLVDSAVGSERAFELGVSQVEAPTIGDFVIELPGFDSQEVTQGSEVRREPLTVVRFSQLGIVSELFHTVASPPIAFLLLVVGLLLVVFELYTAGIGVASLAGVVSLLLASYGLWSLPVRPFALLLVVLAFVAFAVDLQAGVPRLWTAIGAVALVTGSVWLFERHTPSWITFGVAFAGLGVSLLRGIPSLVRSRFSAPSIDRAWLVGEVGSTEGEIAPDGAVRLEGARWWARSESGGPIAAGASVRVTAADGPVLIVSDVYRDMPE